MKLFKFLRAIVAAVCKLIWFVRVENIEALPEKGSAVMVSNHISDLDPVFYLAFVKKRHIHFMAKAELFKYKIVAKFLRYCKAFPIKRGAGDQDALGTAMKTLEDGNVMGIFAEGTRTKTGKLLPFKSGAVAIAQKANAPIVTAVIKTKNQKIRPFRRVTIRFGRVFWPDELGIEGESLLQIKGAVKMVRENVQELLGE
ncbi:MAG: 1-acyl-sn-glycerol-3-phosphate acyltransferase [Clostridia bacterium]|nr:1-acyl-sn-glycerol-3-phosphate acyltransferase [Clostridia bacterium]